MHCITLCTRTHTHTQTHTHAHTHTNTYTHMHTHTQTHTLLCYYFTVNNSSMATPYYYLFKYKTIHVTNM